MSAVHSPATVRQLVRALAPHVALIHHDFSQQTDFDIDEPNAVFVTNPFKTGWDEWGFCEGIFRLLADSMADPETGYFQLLSPTCLPIRPLVEFEAMIAADQHDAHNEFFDLAHDDNALLNFAYRAFAPAGSLRCRVLWRCFQAWTRVSWHVEDRCNLQVCVIDEPPDLPGRLSRSLARTAARGRFVNHPFAAGLRPLVGGTWFGANRKAAALMLQGYARPDLQAWFRQAHLADEMLISTLIGNSGCRVGPSNHFVNEFDHERPRWIDAAHVPAALSSRRYFGRKFADDHEDPVRLDALRRIGAL